MPRGAHGASNYKITFCPAQDEVGPYQSVKSRSHYSASKRTRRAHRLLSPAMDNAADPPSLAESCLTGPSSYQISSKASNLDTVVDEYRSRFDLFSLAPDTPFFGPQANLFPSPSNRGCHGTSWSRHDLSHSNGAPLPLRSLQDIEASSGDTSPSASGQYESKNGPFTSGPTRSSVKCTKRSIKAERSTIAEGKRGDKLLSKTEKFSASINNPLDRPGSIHSPGSSIELSHIQYRPLILATKQALRGAGRWCDRPGATNGTTGIAYSANYYEDKSTRRRRPSLSLECPRTRPLERSRSCDRYFIIEIGPPLSGYGSPPQPMQFECDLEVVQPSLFERFLEAASKTWTLVSQLCIVRHLSRRLRRRLQCVVVLVTVVGAPTCVSVLSGAGINSLFTTGVVTAIIAFGKFLFDRLGGLGPELSSDMIFDCQP